MTTNITVKKLSLAFIFGLFLMIGLSSLVGSAHAQVYYDHVEPYSNYGYHSIYPVSYSNGYPAPQYSYLNVSCSANSLSSSNSLTWTAYASGGNGLYYYTWTGDEGLSGYGQSVYKSYYYPGTKNASVTVTSNGQTVTQTCTPGYVNTNNYYSSYPSYGYPYNSYLNVTCTSNTNSVSVGSPVTWSAYATGGNGYYTYSWSGSEYVYSNSGQTMSVSYATPGTKLASVTVTSNGQTVTQSCSNTVSVSGYGYSNQYAYGYGTTYPNSYGTTYQTNYSTGNYNRLDIGCYVDPSTAHTNQPVTWSAEVTGGSGPYTYSWTGSDGLTGSQSSVIKYYASAGAKSAIVTVTSADGKNGSHACSNQVTVASSYRAPAVAQAAPTYVVPTPVAQATTPTPTASATALVATPYFSLGNVPWGWVAILVILLLFATVLYLLFNREKI